jgi:hypothetical protein
MPTRTKSKYLLPALLLAVSIQLAHAQAPVAPSPPSQKIGDNDPGWLWDQMSKCDTGDASAHAGGPGSSATYIFTGTGVSIYGVSGRTVEVGNVVHRIGKIQVTLDGVVKGQFLDYTPGQSLNTPVCIIRNLPSGNHAVIIEPVDGWAGISSITIDAAAPSNAGNSPNVGAAFHGPHKIPGIIEAEDYDTGGQGVAFYQINNGAQTGYRQDNNSGIEAQPGDSNGYNLGWASPGEWTRYTVNVAAAGKYTVTFRVASNVGQSEAFHLQDSAGINLTGEVNVPNTIGLWTWQPVSFWISLRAGQQVLFLKEDTGNGDWNIDNMTFTGPL